MALVKAYKQIGRRESPFVKNRYYTALLAHHFGL